MASENLGATLATTGTSTAPRLDRDISSITVPAPASASAPAPVPGHTPPSTSHHGHSHSHSHSHTHSYSLSQGQASTSTTITANSLPYDPSLDPTIKALLDQQADIEARLAALLPQKYGPNVKVELDMLRHKLRILRAFAGDNRKQPSSFPHPPNSYFPRPSFPTWLLGNSFLDM